MNTKLFFGSVRNMCSTQVPYWRLLVCACVLLYLGHTPVVSNVVDRGDSSSSDAASVDYTQMMQAMSASGAKINSLAQETLQNPDCFVEITVPQRVGGKCGAVRGGITYCAVDGYFYMNSFEGCESMTTGD